MDEQLFFTNPLSLAQKQYEALRTFYMDKKSAATVANKFGYTLSAFYSLTRDFKKQLRQKNISQRFFITQKPGRKSNEKNDEIRNLIIILRKKYLSVCDSI